jgi:hypothetical protein
MCVNLGVTGRGYLQLEYLDARSCMRHFCIELAAELFMCRMSRPSLKVKCAEILNNRYPKYTTLPDFKLKLKFISNILKLLDFNF